MSGIRPGRKRVISIDPAMAALPAAETAEKVLRLEANVLALADMFVRMQQLVETCQDLVQELKPGHQVSASAPVTDYSFIRQWGKK